MNNESELLKVYIVKFGRLEGDGGVLGIYGTLEKARSYVLNELVQYEEDGYKELDHMSNHWYNGMDSYSIEECPVR